MSPSQTNTRRGAFPDIAGEELTGMEGRLVTLTAGGVVLNASASVVQPYLLLDGAPSGGGVEVAPLDPTQNCRIPLKGTCQRGDTLVLADPATPADKGKVRELPVAAGTYGFVGIAEEDGVDGQLVLVRPFLTGLIKTVS